MGEFHPRLYVACSFQKEASVILDMLLAIEPAARVFTLDTGVLFAETYATWRRVEERYGIDDRRLRGEWIDGLWARDPDACCGMRKVEPLERALERSTPGSPACGATSPPRARARPSSAGTTARQVEGTPLADWTEKDVWRYIAEHDVPYNPLHDRGYASIGCTHCTVAGGGRDGRWAGTDKTECGLHLPAQTR